MTLFKGSVPCNHHTQFLPRKALTTSCNYRLVCVLICCHSSPARMSALRVGLAQRLHHYCLEQCLPTIDVQ